MGQVQNVPLPVQVIGYVREQAPAEPEHCMQCWDLERRRRKKLESRQNYHYMYLFIIIGNYQNYNLGPYIPIIFYKYMFIYI